MVLASISVDHRRYPDLDAALPPQIVRLQTHDIDGPVMSSKRTSRGKLPSLVAELRALAARPSRTFFELGAALTHLREHHSSTFAHVLAEAGISRRRAYYLLEVCDRFSPFMAHKERLRGIGWTKLTVLAPVITADNLTEMLTLAEEISSKQLAEAVKSQAPPRDLRCVLLYLAPDVYERFASAVVDHGGERRGRQLIGTEQALLTILNRLEPRS